MRSIFEHFDLLEISFQRRLETVKLIPDCHYPTWQRVPYWRCCHSI